MNQHEKVCGKNIKISIVINGRFSAIFHNRIPCIFTPFLISTSIVIANLVEERLGGGLCLTGRSVFADCWEPWYLRGATGGLDSEHTKLLRGLKWCTLICLRWDKRLKNQVYGSQSFIKYVGHTTTTLWNSNNNLEAGTEVTFEGLTTRNLRTLIYTEKKHKFETAFELESSCVFDKEAAIMPA